MGSWNGFTSIAALAQPLASQLQKIIDFLTAAPEPLMPVYKSADTPITSQATLADDPHLVATLAASATYLLRVDGTYNAAATPDLKINFSSPAGTTGNLSGLDATAAFTNVSLGTDLNFTASGGTTVRLLIFGVITTAGTAGTFKLRLAQVTSNASASTLHRNTRMDLVRIA